MGLGNHLILSWESIKDFQLVGLFILVITITLVVGIIFLGRIDLKYFKDRKNIGEQLSKTMFSLTISSYILISFFTLMITVVGRDKDIILLIVGIIFMVMILINRYGGNNKEHKKKSNNTCNGYNKIK